MAVDLRSISTLPSGSARRTSEKCPPSYSAEISNSCSTGSLLAGCDKDNASDTAASVLCTCNWPDRYSRAELMLSANVPSRMTPIARVTLSSNCRSMDIVLFPAIRGVCRPVPCVEEDHASG
ncbi:hypothetical protein D3C87_1662090 [compost metagenome]